MGEEGRIGLRFRLRNYGRDFIIEDHLRHRVWRVGHDNGNGMASWVARSSVESSIVRQSTRYRVSQN